MAFFLLVHGLNAQNLIPNSSFEEYTKCPDGLRQLEYAIGWKRANAGTPEFFHACGFTQEFKANTGEGFAGVILKTQYASIVEYLQVELNQYLEKDKSYCLSYFIRLSGNSLYAINKIGAYFSKERLLSPSWKQFLEKPQLVYEEIVADTANWKNYKQSFKAVGGEKFLTIGNFFSNDKLKVIAANNGAKDKMAYYYFDDVELYEVESGCESRIRPDEPTKKMSWQHTVYFEKDSVIVSEDEFEKLLSFVNSIPKPLLQAIKIEGHTDTDASFEYNYALSQNRAENIRKQMIIFGFKNVYATWFGEENPTNKESDKFEKAENRRVEIIIE